MSSVLRNGPTVCCVADNYCIVVPVNKDCFVSIKVGNNVYYNHSNGIRVSNTSIHKFYIPMEVLDKFGHYTVVYDEVTERLAYSVSFGESGVIEYSFKPVCVEKGLNIFHLSDTHGLINEAVLTGSYFSDKPDLLILNGDIAPDSESENSIFTNYDICYSITGGERPCIVTRGNHDLRGFYAEKLGSLLPDYNGKSYYPVFLNGITFLVLDCGEDKLDSNKEYSGSICCHDFRMEEDLYLKSFLETYNPPVNGINVLLSHIPVCYDNIKDVNDDKYEFFIEEDLYTSWCSIIKERFRPAFYLAGHIHMTDVFTGNNRFDNRGLNVPIVFGGCPVKHKGADYDVLGTAISIINNKVEIRFTDSKHNTVKEAVFLEV